MSEPTRINPPAELSIIGTQIRADERGRYCLNDMHRASGAQEKHKPSRFLRNAGIKAFVAALDAKLIREAKDQNWSSVEVRRGGDDRGGVFAHELVVLRYAAWISAEFEVEVYSEFKSAKDAERKREFESTAVQHQQLAQLDLALQTGKGEASLCGKVLGKWGKRRRTLVERIEALERVLQLTLDGIEPAALSHRLQ